jgi:hypothetical protein
MTVSYPDGVVYPGGKRAGSPPEPYAAAHVQLEERLPVAGHQALGKRGQQGDNLARGGGEGRTVASCLLPAGASSGDVPRGPIRRESRRGST